MESFRSMTSQKMCCPNVRVSRSVNYWTCWRQRLVSCKQPLNCSCPHGLSRNRKFRHINITSQSQGKSPVFCQPFSHASRVHGLHSIWITCWACPCAFIPGAESDCSSFLQELNLLQELAEWAKLFDNWRSFPTPTTHRGHCRGWVHCVLGSSQGQKP